MNTMITVSLSEALWTVAGGAFFAGSAIILVWMVGEKNRIIDELVEAIHGPDDEDEDDGEEEGVPTMGGPYLNSKGKK